MNIGNVQLDHLRGLGDKVVGLAKETFGTVAGNDQLVKAGESQQAKGTESLKALRHEAKAEAKEAKAATFETKQRAAQRAKEGAA